MVEPSRKPYTRNDACSLTPKNFRIFSVEQDGMAWQQLIRADNSNDATRAARKISALPGARATDSSNNSKEKK